MPHGSTVLLSRLHFLTPGRRAQAGPELFILQIEYSSTMPQTGFRTCTLENELLLCASSPQCSAGLHIQDSSEMSVTLRRFTLYGVSEMGEGGYDTVQVLLLE